MTTGPAQGRHRDHHEVLTVPNAITLVRLLCIPVFVVLVVHPSERYPAAVLLAVLGATDWVDGYLARRLGQVSAVGKVLDPVADRALLITGVAAIVAVGAVPIPVAVLTLAREGLVAVGTLIIAAAGGGRLDVSWAGKAGTFGLMFAFPLFLIGHSTAGWHSAAEVLAWCCAVAGLIFAWYATWSYVPLGRKALADSRASRTDRPAPAGAPQEVHP